MENNLYPQAFGPGSWRGLSEDLIRVYSTLQKTESEAKLEQEESLPLPQELELVEV